VKPLLLHMYSQHDNQRDDFVVLAFIIVIVSIIIIIIIIIIIKHIFTFVTLQIGE
jgi:hypothetical protein